MKKIKKRLIGFIIFLIFCILIIPYLANSVNLILTTKNLKMQNYFIGMKNFIQQNSQGQLLIALLLFALFFIAYISLLVSLHTGVKKKGTIKITDNIYIPEPVGNGQFGNARFLTNKEKNRLYKKVIYYPGVKLPENERYGLVIGMEKDGDKENIYYIKDDAHSIIVAATRSGKSRRYILQSIWLSAKSTVSMIITDIKGELFLYTYPYLKQNGFNTLYLNFKNPKKSMRYNFLQPVLNALEEGDKAEAINATWDIVSTLVGEAKGEKLWNDGESSAIASCILAVALEAPRGCKNLTNVYYFLWKMCEYDENLEDMPINQYIRTLPDTHPAVAVFAQAKIAPTRTRGSFFTSALGTLRHFTNPSIAAMTAESDFDLSILAKEKTALFFMFPDEKHTLYSLGSILLDLTYQTLSKEADKNGGRVPINCDYYADEVGNFPKIPSLPSLITAGAGKGIRFNPVVQDFEQFYDKYEKGSKTIKNNCANWIYIKSASTDTQKEFSERIGKYTVQAESSSSSSSSGGTKGVGNNYSQSVNMTGRPLLMPEEIGRIQAPYSLCLTAGEFPTIMKIPDLSEYHANKELGLGNEEFNQKVKIEREAAIKEIEVIDEPKLWGIWNTYKGKECNTRTISFLD